MMMKRPDAVRFGIAILLYGVVLIWLIWMLAFTFQDELLAFFQKPTVSAVEPIFIIGCLIGMVGLCILFILTGVLAIADKIHLPEPSVRYKLPYRITVTGHDRECAYPDWPVKLQECVYPSRLLKEVNHVVHAGRQEEAARMLWSLTALSYEEAQNVIKDWKMYYPWYCFIQIWVVNA